MPHPAKTVRVLFLADSHLGFDLPSRPRVERRRRGHDFLANHRLALAAAGAGEVDLVVHGGDVFHRPRVPPSLAFQAFRPLMEVADQGVPVFVVPGNHERSRIPHERFAAHPNLHIFHRPETFTLKARSLRISLSGFPYQRRRIRETFPQVVAETGWKHHQADVRLLCMHHCVEGATVGPAEYTFRHAPDVIRCDHLPAEFAAALSGHIHRHQVLRRDLRGRPLPTPVLYPGSVERTAFAEMGEEKGFMLLEFEGGRSGGRLVRQEFAPLPARPMLLRDLRLESEPFAFWRRQELEARLTAFINEAPGDAVLRVRVHGRVPPAARKAVSAPRLREITPPEMNLEVLLAEERVRRRRTDFPPRHQEHATDCVQIAHFPFGSD